jgi:polysaccharide biosynthesis protein PslH
VPAGVRGHLVDVQPHGWWTASVRSLRSGRPVSVERHAHTALATQVEELVRRERFDLVHVEQPQALAAAMPAIRAGLGCVLRAQNVESGLWQRGRQGRLAGPLFRAEAARMRRFEAAALATADLTIALSAADAAQLSTIDPSARVIVIPPPIDPMQPAASRALPGDPACVWIGSAGWASNAKGAAWLLAEIWPAIAATLPHARLHVFGPGALAQARTQDAIVIHDAPHDSRDAFDAGSILLLPLRAAAGVRMRLLEAWSRGVPVIASPAAVEGLEATDGDDVLIAGDAHEFAACVGRLAGDGELRARLIRGGRTMLARRHDPATIARVMLDAYREAIDRHRARRQAHASARPASAAR